jgi:hypothetical protein
MENESTLNILVRTIEQMPTNFTSREFTLAALSNGYPERMTKGRGLAPFIKRFAVNDYYRSKRWTKTEASVGLGNLAGAHSRVSDASCQQINLIAIDDDLEAAVELLKKHGYKIMKPVEEWIEC